MFNHCHGCRVSYPECPCLHCQHDDYPASEDNVSCCQRHRLNCECLGCCDFKEEKEMELLDEIQALLDKHGIKSELEMKPAQDIYQPFEPSDIHFSVSAAGEILKNGAACLEGRTAFFNGFATEKFAQYAAETAKIHNLFWQWKEQFDPEFWPDLRFWAEMENNNGWISTHHACYSSSIGPFSSRELADRFIHECHPYLDEYDRAVGWV